MTLSAGMQAPDFTLPTDGGGSVTLSALKGQTVILYFYPKDDTTGCTAQACGFRDAEASHDKFKKKYALPFALASDEAGHVCEDYGVWAEKSMYGRKYMGIERTTFLIDKSGVIRRVWNKVKVPGHVPEVLSAAEGL
jgi:peroxiredoxin Q/BCP